MIMKHLFLLTLLCVTGIFLTSAQTSNWVFTGPSNFPTNISGQINGIGRVCQLKFDPNNPNTMYACSASGGLWKSTNAGTSWTSMGTDKLPKMKIASVCIDHTNSNIIYLGSGDPNYYTNNLGIWKTTDGGLNWAQVNTGIGTFMALELLMDSTDHLTLLAATSNGIWKTIDGGLNWTNKLAGNQFTDMKWKAGAGSQVVFASSFNKFFRSADKGDTWTEITSGFNGLLANGTRIATSAMSPSTVYVGTVFDQGTIFRSTDDGLNFTVQYHNPTWSLTGYDSTGGGQGNYNFCIEANPTNANQLFLGSHNIMRSDDAGITWQKLTTWSKIVHTDMHDYLFQPGNSTNLYQANDGGVWLTSTSGTTWSPKSDGLGATENYTAATSPLYSKLMSTGTQDNGELLYTNAQWKTNRGGDWTTKMQMDYSPQQWVYYFNYKKRRALPSGSSDAYNVPTTLDSSILKHVFSPDDQNLAYISGVSIWQTKNLSQSAPVWTQIATSSSVIRAMAVCRLHPTIFAYSINNKFYISHDALNATPTFTMTTLPTSSTNTDMVISAIDTNHIFIILNKKVYESTDGGMVFTDYSGSLPVVNQLKIYLDEYSGNNGLYVGNALGVYYRNNSMSDWVNYSGVLPTIASIKDIMYFNDGGADARVYVSYFGRGVWETKLENSHTCPTPVISGTSFSGSNVTIHWNNTGANQYDIQYREIGTLPWTKFTSATNTAFISSYIGCSSYEVRVRGKCNADSSLWSDKAFFNTPTNTMNNDFDNHMDIGSVGAAGSVCYDAVNQRYTIYASGADIWGQNDQFHFLYKKLQGDVTISARVKHIGNIYGWAKGGVMIRESLNTNSKHSMCALTPGNGFANQWRDATGGNSANVDTAGKEPGWVKVERLGSSFTSYFSTDGNTWNVLNTATIPMNDTVYVGLANCSHIDSTINDAIFDHIIINGVALSMSSVEQNNAPFTVSPNPVRNQLNIQFIELLSSSDLHITVLDALGNVVLKEKRTNNALTQSLNTSALPSGVYFLEIQGRTTSVTKFVKE